MRCLATCCLDRYRVGRQHYLRNGVLLATPRWRCAFRRRSLSEELAAFPTGKSGFNHLKTRLSNNSLWSQKFFLGRLPEHYWKLRDPDFELRPSNAVSWLFFHPSNQAHVRNRTSQPSRILRLVAFNESCQIRFSCSSRSPGFTDGWWLERQVPHGHTSLLTEFWAQLILWWI